MRKLNIIILFLIAVLVVNCTAVTKDNSNLDNALTQVSTIDALLSGIYDGHMTLGKLKEYGDFGLGTFDKLEGEMLVLDGVVYQIKVDGKVYVPKDTLSTPFAAVSDFHTFQQMDCPTGIEYDSLVNFLEQKISNKNQFVGIKITGRFNYMKTRSVPAQEKPYPPLAEVTPYQAVFEMENIDGTVVGYYCPGFVDGINVPGFHLHFLSKDKSKGGHILNLITENCLIEFDTYNEFSLILPEDNEDFNNTDFNEDRGEELEDVEKNE